MTVLIVLPRIDVRIPQLPGAVIPESAESELASVLDPEVDPDPDVIPDPDGEPDPVGVTDPVSDPDGEPEPAMPADACPLLPPLLEPLRPELSSIPESLPDPPQPAITPRTIAQHPSNFRRCIETPSRLRSPVRRCAIRTGAPLNEPREPRLLQSPKQRGVLMPRPSMSRSVSSRQPNPNIDPRCGALELREAALRLR